MGLKYLGHWLEELSACRLDAKKTNSFQNYMYTGYLQKKRLKINTFNFLPVGEKQAM